MDKGKMSKSAGFLHLDQLVADGFAPLDYRYLIDHALPFEAEVQLREPRWREAGRGHRLCRGGRGKPDRSPAALLRPRPSSIRCVSP
jgi:hypothetical protein